MAELQDTAGGVRWAAWLKIIHAAMGVVVLLYLAMVATNSLGFGYNFWKEPPPNAIADTFAVCSLWVLFLSAGLVGAVAYTWLCAHEIDPHAPLLEALRRARRVTFRSWIPAMTGFAATAVACLLVFLGPPVILWLAAVPARRLREDGWGCDVASPQAGVTQFRAAIGVTALVSVPFWLALQWGFTIADNWDGVVEGLAALLVYLAAVTAGLGAAWGARQFSRMTE